MRSLKGAGILGLVLLVGCADSPTSVAPQAVRLDAPTPGVAANVINNAKVSQLLQHGGRFAESSYMACIMSYYVQGVSLRDIRQICTEELSWQGAHGWGPGASAIDGVLAGFGGPAGDPPSVTATCGGGGDPKLSRGQKLERGTLQTNDDATGYNHWGEYTWGEPAGGCDDNFCYNGLTQDESFEAKYEATIAARHAEIAAREAEELSKANPNDADLKADAEQKRAAAEAKKKEAAKDPNKKEPGKSDGLRPDLRVRVTQDQSTCEGVLQVARDLIAECNRTDWKRTECQQLHARVNGCPDPTLIYVDPESGYECAPKIDPEQVIEAWRRHCEQVVTPGPDGGSPCNKPLLSEGGRYATGQERDICRSPIALTDPENDGCIGTMPIDTFGQTDINELIVWGQGVFGGPIVVLPKPPLPFPH